MINLASDLIEFATARDKALTSLEKDLAGSVRLAVRSLMAGDDDWADALLDRGEKALRSQYRAEGDQTAGAGLDSAVSSFRKDIGAMLAKTKKPTEKEYEARVAAITTSLGTAVLNFALEAAGNDDDDDFDQVWITMEDASVRPDHFDVHGQRRAMGEPFDVGGSKMSRPGDVTAPVRLWINCRCVLGLVPAEATGDALTAAAGDHDTSVGAFFLAADEDPVNDLSSEDRAHVTTLWFGDSTEVDIDIDAIKAAIERVVPNLSPMTVDVMNRGELGDAGADVLFLNRDQVIDARDALLAEPDLQAAVDAVEQHPEWTPHVTLGYPETPANDGDVPDTITIDRLSLWVGNEHYDYALGETMTDDTDVDSNAVTPDPVPWHGVLAPEGVLSGDRRRFKVGSLSTRELPLPLAWQKASWEGHDSSIVVARIDRTWMDDRSGTPLMWGEGEVLMSVPEADEFIALVAEGGVRGVSVDADDAAYDLCDEAGNKFDFDEMDEDSEPPVLDFTKARVCGATVCSIPAFAQAFIALGAYDDALYFPPEGTDEPDVHEEEGGEEATTEALALTASAITEFAPGTEDGPGWLTHPVDTDRLRDYWVSGLGAAKIGWGTPGDFNRCRAHLAEYIKPQYLSGYCANRHKDALGIWPGQHASRKVITASARTPAVRLVKAKAKGDESRPPREWFSDPKLIELSAVVVTEEGRVFGHLAGWETCHVGYKDFCQTAPHSSTDYAYYRTGAVLCSDGTQVATGPITMGTGHADQFASARVAVAHYDDTGTAVCDVAVGEDEFGVWVAGAVRATATPEQIDALRGSALSGDWREFRGSDDLELVAALAVNVPGFPIPRTGLAASAGRQVSLVAAGIVLRPEPTENRSLKEIVAEAVRETLAQRRNEETKAGMMALAASVGMDPKSRMLALASAHEEENH